MWAERARLRAGRRHFRRPALVLAVAGLLACVACEVGPPSGTGTPTSDTVAGTPRSVLVDYSPTVSDVGALLYLATHPDVRLEAITLAGTGESTCAAGVSNTAALLERIGHPPVPIACGPESPVGPGRRWPEAWRVASDELAPLDLPETEVPAVAGGAVGLIAETAAATDDLVIVALGPLTNLAHVVREHPGVIDDVSMTYTMGGALTVAGNAPNGTAEWNYYVDATAVDQVVRSGLPLTVVPLDATDDVPASVAWWQRLERAAVGVGAPAAVVVNELWAAATPWSLGFSLWDELAAIVAVDDDFAETTTERIAVVTDGLDTGRTVIDAAGTPVRVVVHPDRRAVEDELLRRLSGQGQRVLPADEPCRNQRVDERGEPVPADDIYVDDRTIDWVRTDPADAGFDPDRLDAAVRDVALNPSVLSLLIVRDGELVTEEYFHGADAAHAHNLFSTTKLLTVLAIGAAVDDGIVPSITTSLGNWVDETADGPIADVTLEQVLTMRSGLDPEPVEPFDADVVAATAPVAPPGTGWEYNTNNSELLALGLDRRTDDGWCEYVHERVLGPIGVTVDHWHETPYGGVTGGSYAFATPRELARLGQLLLDDGATEGEQVVSADWVDAITTQHTDSGCQPGVAAWSNRSLPSAYGMHLQLTEIAGHEVWSAGGYGGQAIVVVPDLELVVVITQEVGPVFERRLGVIDTLEFAILPALDPFDEPPAAACPVSRLVALDAAVTATATVGDAPDGRVLLENAGGPSDWSPDGERIAFGSIVDLNPELYVIDADGTGLRRLTTNGAADAVPRWSPDGASLAFLSDRDAVFAQPIPEFDLWIHDVATGREHLVTEGFGDVLGHSWSPYGSRIVFSRAAQNDHPGGDLWVVDVDTGEAELLAAGELAWPEWSPDGDTIAAVDQRGGDQVVVLIDANSGEATDLTAGDLPRWTPDGRELLVQRGDTIVRVDVDDGLGEPVTDGCCASVAPDGRRLVVSRQS